jgi:hypothetical protein
MIIISSHGWAGQSATAPDYTLLGRGTVLDNGRETSVGRATRATSCGVSGLLHVSRLGMVPKIRENTKIDPRIP